jgi:hypothetical protein
MMVRGEPFVIRRGVGERLASGILLLAGSLINGVGVYEWLGHHSPLAASALCGAGFVLLAGSIFLYSVAVSRPERITIERGGITVASAGAIASVPGIRIGGIEIRRVRGRHIVSALRDDGSFFDLRLFFLKRRARSFQEAASMPFDRGRVDGPSARPSKNLSIIDTDGAVIFAWSDRYTLRFIVALFLLLSGIILMSGGPLSGATGSRHLLALPLLWGAAALWYTRIHSRRTALRIRGASAEYGRLLSDGGFISMNNFSGESLKSITFSYDASTPVQYINADLASGRRVRIPLTGLLPADAEILCGWMRERLG